MVRQFPFCLNGTNEIQITFPIDICILCIKAPLSLLHFIHKDSPKKVRNGKKKKKKRKEKKKGKEKRIHTIQQFTGFRSANITKQCHTRVVSVFLP